MSFKLIGGGSSLDTAVSDINQNILELKGREVTEIFKDDTGTRRVLLGKGADGFYGLRVSQEGVDVYTATLAQLVFNSDNNLFKIVASGTTTLDYDGNVNTFATVAHGQSNIPIVLAYVQLPNNANFSPMAGQYVPMPVYINRTGLPAVQCVQSVDSTNIYLRVHDIYAPPNQTYNFRYYVLQETAS